MKNWFKRSLGLVIGVNQYSGRVPVLRSAIPDAKAIADDLRTKHGFQTQLLIDADVVAAEKALLDAGKDLDWDDRLLLYFAGHGIAPPGQVGPEGFFLLKNAEADDESTWWPMRAVDALLGEIRCRHVLAIFDCCFAGAFQWTAAREHRTLPRRLHQEHFARFVTDPARQVIVSAACDQKALDAIHGHVLGQRESNPAAAHSPFAAALLRALDGAADLAPAGGDGIITATELQLYLRDVVERQTLRAAWRQTPQLSELKGHGKGEFVFLVPGSAPDIVFRRLLPLPELVNPYLGLDPYLPRDSSRFFGRERVVRELYEAIIAGPLTVVLGPSGSGKSSAVQAGLIPLLESLGKPSDRRGILPGAASWRRDIPIKHWRVPLVDGRAIRPGSNPLRSLCSLATALGVSGISPDALRADPATFGARVAEANSGGPCLIFIDQYEEIITRATEHRSGAQDAADFVETLRLMLVKAAAHRNIHVVLTLRSDFEPRLAEGPLSTWWTQGRRLVSALAEEELAEIIDAPAAQLDLYFEEKDRQALIREVIQMATPLPMLSFALQEIFESWQKGIRESRILSLPRAFASQGGVVGCLRKVADNYARALDVLGRRTLENLLLRLVSSDSGRLARREVTEQELIFADPTENERVRRILTDLSGEKQRLIVSSKRDTVDHGVVKSRVVHELAHEALLHAWPAIVETRVKRQRSGELLPAVTRAALERKDRGGALWTEEIRLDEALRVGEAEPGLFNEHEGDFLQESLRSRQARVRRRRWEFGVTTFVLVGIAAVAIWLWRTAADRTAENDAVEMASVADARLPGEADVAVLVALAAHQLKPGPQTRFSIFQALRRRPQLARSHHLSGFSGRRCQIAPNTPQLLTWDGNRGLAIVTLAPDGAITKFEHLIKDARIQAASWHPSGTSLAALVNNKCALYADRKWKEVKFDFPPSDFRSVAWRPQGDLLAIGTNRSLYICDPTSGKTIRSMAAPTYLRDDGATGLSPVEELAWNPDGTVVAALSGPFVLLAPVELSRATQELDGVPSLSTTASVEVKQKWAPAHLAWHPKDGTLVCSPTTQGNLVLWDPVTGKTLAETGILNRGQTRVSWSQDGTRLAVSTSFDAVHIFDHPERGVLRGPESLVCDADDVAWVAEKLVTVEEQGPLRWWSLDSGWPFAAVKDIGRPDALVWEPKGNRLAVVSSQSRDGPANSLALISVASSQAGATPILEAEGHLYSVVWHPSDGMIYGLGRKGLAALDPGTKKIQQTWNSQLPEFREAVLTPDSARAALLMDADPLKYSTEQQDLLGRILRLVDPRSGKLISEYHSANGRLDDIAWDDAGKRLVAVEADTVKIFGIDEVGHLHPTLTMGKNPIDQLTGNNEPRTPRFSPSGELVAAMLGKGKIRVWNARSGRIVSTFQAHPDPCRTLTWLSGDRLATGNTEDERIKIWDVHKGSLLFSVSSDRFCQSLAFHSKQDLLASIWQNLEVRLYSLNEQRWREYARKIVDRNLTPDEWTTFVGAQRDHRDVFSDVEQP